MQQPCSYSSPSITALSDLSASGELTRCQSFYRQCGSLGQLFRNGIPEHQPRKRMEVHYEAAVIKRVSLLRRPTSLMLVLPSVAQEPCLVRVDLRLQHYSQTDSETL